MAEERSEQQQNQRMQGQTAPGQAEGLVKEKKQEPVESAQYRYCKYCEEPLAPNEKFCRSCGEEYGGKENICPYDQTATTKKYCPLCKNLIVPNTCPKCGASTIQSVCACGEILDKKLQAAVQTAQQIQKEALKRNAPPAVRQMTAEEIQKLEAAFKKEEENPDYQKLHKRLLEREKLLNERGYYNKMEKRIIEVFGEIPFKIQIPDPEEQAARMRIYASLEQSILKKQRLATQAELEALYPELHYIHEMENKAADEKAAAEEAARNRRAEIAKREREMEEKYNSILNGIDQEIKEVREEERRAEEERREQERKRLLAEKAAEEAKIKKEREEAERKEREESRKRAEAFAAQKAALEKSLEEDRLRWAAQDKAAAESRAQMINEARQEAEKRSHLNRVLGNYIFEGGDRVLTLMINSITDGNHKSKWPEYKDPFYQGVRIIFNGSRLTIEETSNPSGITTVCALFKGDINNNGTAITGNWYRHDGEPNNIITYYKTRT